MAALVGFRQFQQQQAQQRNQMDMAAQQSQAQAWNNMFQGINKGIDNYADPVTRKYFQDQRYIQQQELLKKQGEYQKQLLEDRYTVTQDRQLKQIEDAKSRISASDILTPDEKQYAQRELEYKAIGIKPARMPKPPDPKEIVQQRMTVDPMTGHRYKLKGGGNSLDVVDLDQNYAKDAAEYHQKIFDSLAKRVDVDPITGEQRQKYDLKQQLMLSDYMTNQRFPSLSDRVQQGTPGQNMGQQPVPVPQAPRQFPQGQVPANQPTPQMSATTQPAPSAGQPEAMPRTMDELMQRLKVMQSQNASGQPTAASAKQTDEAKVAVLQGQQQKLVDMLQSLDQRDPKYRAVLDVSKSVGKQILATKIDLLKKRIPDNMKGQVYSQISGLLQEMDAADKAKDALHYRRAQAALGQLMQTISQQPEQ